MGNKIEIKKFLEKEGIKAEKIIKLIGDASEREFYRVFTPEGKFIFLLYPSPVNRELNLIKAYELYTKSNLPVSKILRIWFEKGAFLLQDLGNESLQKFVKNKNAEEISQIYYQAIDLIQIIQKKGLVNIDESYFSNRYKLDRKRLSWEMDFFLENYVQKFLKKRVDKEKYKKLFKKLIELIDLEKKVLCHRDYHSRNLFILHNKIYIIDYQDTTLGPPLYDLASLIYDSYVNLGKRLKSKLIDYAYELNNYGWKFEEFQKQFLLTCLQRNIKALGTFGYLVIVRRKKHYKNYIKRTTNYIKKNLKFFKELDKIQELLE